MKMAMGATNSISITFAKEWDKFVQCGLEFQEQTPF